MRYIDVETWDRAIHYHIFKDNIQLHYCITFDFLAKQTEEEQDEYFVPGINRDNIYQFSSMPWVTYTQISHTDSGAKDDATPVFVWGKYYEKEIQV